jgi:hypothetical protein
VGIKRTFFYKLEKESVNLKDYLYLANYKFYHPNEEVNLCCFKPTEVTYYSHLITALSVALLPFDSEEPKYGTRLKLRSNKIKGNLLSYPFYDMAEYIGRVITDKMIVLDLGCGNRAIDNQFQYGKVISLDVFPKFNPDILYDLNNTPLPFCDNHFDIVLLLDVIEHLPKENGIKLLAEAKRICKGKLFIFTPLWWLKNDEETNNPKSEYYKNEHNLHQCLWKEEELIEFTRILNPLVDKYFFGYWERK